MKSIPKTAYKLLTSQKLKIARKTFSFITYAKITHIIPLHDLDHPHSLHGAVLVHIIVSTPDATK
jgi:hypothetical protein